VGITGIRWEPAPKPYKTRLWRPQHGKDQHSILPSNIGAKVAKAGYRQKFENLSGDRSNIVGSSLRALQIIENIRYEPSK
jgi:hypothetical protein